MKAKDNAVSIVFSKEWHIFWLDYTSTTVFKGYSKKAFKEVFFWDVLDKKKMTSDNTSL